MTAPLLITGGTGTLGRLVLPRLLDTGAKLRVLSRSDHPSGDGAEFVTGDLATGAGLETAMDGVGTVVHCAGSAKGDDEKARHLVRAASRAGVGHIVYISVVGADRIPVVSATDRAMFGYFAAKRGAEEIIADSQLPWTTLRATQFYDLILTVAQGLAKLPIVPVPAAPYQPIDAGEVADRLVELALGAPAGLVPDLGGPRVYDLPELVRSYLRATHRRRIVLPLRPPGKAGRAVRAGATLTPDRMVGRKTWEEFLAERVR
jgi:uncharacterized protein YbjT (DUF2867 family)